jgi:16S rRNA (cytosine967-C5)-methyltransferase
LNKRSPFCFSSLRMHLHSYLRSAAGIIQLYDGTIPFTSWLKNYFKQNKKFGSKDRRFISDLCYCYFRLGKSFPQMPVEEKMLTAQFLCHTNSAFMKELKPQWEPFSSAAIDEKLKVIGEGKLEGIFPYAAEISSSIEQNIYSLSHLVQPDLFLRVRPKKKEPVLQKLTAAAIPFSIEENCLRLPNNSKVDDIIEVDKDAVVQDKSSQQVLNALKEQWQKSTFTSWDCCAASGGKTILLHDLFPKAQLTVSDIRESILHNLKNRFRRAGIQQFQSFVADVSSTAFRTNKKYDVIICDAPCSGSGTWGRTPEQLQFFPSEKITHYTNLQKNIALNASRSLQAGGTFVYITCSVFKRENEDVVNYLLQNTPLQLADQRYMKGYTEKADTLFAALFFL